MAKGSATIPEASYGPGTTILGPANVAGNLSEASVAFDVRQHTDPEVLFDFTVEISISNGPWQGMGGFTRPGGPITSGPDGIPDETMGCVVRHPPGGGRRIRGVMTVTGGAVVTSGTIEWQ
jgi:hypothetical protein